MKNQTSKTVEKKDEVDTGFLDTTLRPNKWDEYIGQDNIKNNLRILLSAAEERKHPPEHILFYGPPGLGKTTLAHLVAKEMQAQMKVTSGPAIEKVGDLASILTNLSPGDILFIDEIHRLNKTIEEILYPAMESGSHDIIYNLPKGVKAETPTQTEIIIKGIVGWLSLANQIRWWARVWATKKFRKNVNWGIRGIDLCYESAW